MDISDYNAMLCAIDMARNLRVPFEARAKEIALKILGDTALSIRSVSFSESRVTCVYDTGYPSCDGTEEVVNIPVEWLFDESWQEKYRAESETKRQRWEERMKKQEEEDRKRKEEKERAEFDRLKKKYGG
jgi:hypothetical protein